MAISQVPITFSDHAAGVALGGLRVAVLIPCRNEERTVAAVVRDFRTALPRAAIHVCDNNSTDGTVAAARAAGATIGREMQQGKGNVVRRMFADIEADIYVLVDGDGTYDARSAPKLVETLIEDRLDLVNGMRMPDSDVAFRRGHRVGNVMLSQIIALVFGNRFRDTLSGYKVFSRRFVKSFPAHARGFDIEAELIVHALELGMPVRELETPYVDRPLGSSSKLRTVRDGIRVLGTIAILVKEERPLSFFAWVFLLLAAISILLAAPVITTYSQTGLVPRMPTAVLATGMMLLAFLSLTCGLILNTVTRGRREMKHMHYLSIPRIVPADTESEG